MAGGHGGSARKITFANMPGLGGWGKPVSRGRVNGHPNPGHFPKSKGARVASGSAR